MEKIETNDGIKEKEIESLKVLAKSEIRKIEQLPQPVVRVCGPLTCDGPEGYDRNAARLVRAEEVLQSKDMSVWTFSEAEEGIFGKGYHDDNIFSYFHKPILESGVIKKTYFLPRWNESNGSTLERKTAVGAGVDILEFPEKWF